MIGSFFNLFADILSTSSRLVTGGGIIASLLGPQCITGLIEKFNIHSYSDFIASGVEILNNLVHKLNTIISSPLIIAIIVLLVQVYYHLSQRERALELEDTLVGFGVISYSALFSNLNSICEGILYTGYYIASFCMELIDAITGSEIEGYFKSLPLGVENVDMHLIKPIRFILLVGAFTFLSKLILDEDLFDIERKKHSYVGRIYIFLFKTFVSYSSYYLLIHTCRILLNLLGMENYVIFPQVDHNFGVEVYCKNIIDDIVLLINTLVG